MKTTKGKFNISGIYFLDIQIKKMILKEVAINSPIELIPDINNEYDEYAIKVLYNNIHIGWYEGKGYRKKEVYKELLKGTPISASICHIYNRGTTKIELQAQYQYVYDETSRPQRHPKPQPQHIDMEEYRQLTDAQKKLEKLLTKTPTKLDTFLRRLKLKK